jgi:hypothetical protein
MRSVCRRCRRCRRCPRPHHSFPIRRWRHSRRQLLRILPLPPMAPAVPPPVPPLLCAPVSTRNSIAWDARCLGPTICSAPSVLKRLLLLTRWQPWRRLLRKLRSRCCAPNPHPRWDQEWGQWAECHSLRRRPKSLVPTASPASPASWDVRWCRPLTSNNSSPDSNPSNDSDRGTS